MSEFYNNFHNINNEYDKLDKMARQINNNRTSLFNKVKNDTDNEEKQWATGIDTIINSNNFSYLPMNKNYQNQLYSSNIDEYKMTQNNKKNKMSDNYSDNHSNSNNYSDNHSNNYSDNYSDNHSNNYSDNSELYSESESQIKSEIKSDLYSNIDSETLDSYLDSVSIDYDKNKTNKTSKTKNNFAKIVKSLHYDECSRDSDNIFDHIKNCLNCKNKLLKFLNINNINNKEDNEIMEFGKSLFIKTHIGSKEIITVIMLGLFVIFILDIIIRTKRH